MRRSLLISCLLAILALLLVGSAQGGPGSHRHLGSAGTSAGTPASSDAARALALQSDGKFVAAGFGSNKFALARYWPNGSRDRGFGVAGRVLTDIVGGDSEAVAAVALQRNGKVIAAGSASYPPMNTEWPVLARYRRDGRLDRTFGRNGIVQTHFRRVDGRNMFEAIHAVAIRRDGKIVAAGDSEAYDTACSPEGCAPTTGPFVLARFLPSGRLDRSFGSGGKVLTDVGSQSIDVAEALAVQRDGKLVVAGRRGSASGSQWKSDFVLLRYRTDGQLDPSFGNAGIVVTGFGAAAFDEAEAVALQGNGGIVAAGRSCPLPHGQTACRVAVARYLPDGRLDPSFAGGTVLLRFGSAGFNEASAVAIQRDGKIVVAGRSGHATGRRSRFALARFLLNGRLDRSFGAGGKVLTQVRRGRFGAVSALVLARRGKVLAAGQTGLGPYAPGDFALARYRRDGRLDRTFGKAGKVLTDFGPAERSPLPRRSASRRPTSEAAAPPHRGTLFATCAGQKAFTVRGDGSAYHRLRLGLTLPGVAFAPDGRRIAFARVRFTPTRVLVKVARADGTHERTVATVPPGRRGRPDWTRGLAWSPDSRSLAFTTFRGLWVARPDGARARLIAARHGAAAPVWSPRGDWIAFQRAYGRSETLTGVHDIYIVSPKGSSLRRVATVPGYGGEPVSWSPDGRRIVYQTKPDQARRNSTLRSLDLRTGAERVLGAGYRPAWSPRGDLIAFYVVKRAEWEIGVERPDGTGRRVLAKGPSWPVWSPAGDQIAFGAYYSRVMTVAVGGGAPRKIVPQRCQVDYLGWSR